MPTSTIQIDVHTDENKRCEKLVWSAQDGAITDRPAKAMILGMWDDAEGMAMRIDLWTKEMQVDEMQHFVCQTLMTLADTYEKATSDTPHATAIRGFTKELAERLGVLKPGEGR
ncbi:MAG: gliding motility protein GldC [Bacteroidota bacterium]|jgi:gliding motility-associated protein GldC